LLTLLSKKAKLVRKEMICIEKLQIPCLVMWSEQRSFRDCFHLKHLSVQGLADLYEKLQTHIDRVTADILAEETKRRERIKAVMVSNSQPAQSSELRKSVGVSRTSIISPSMGATQVQGVVESRDGAGRLEDLVEGAVDARESTGGALEKGGIGSGSAHPHGSEGSADQSKDQSRITGEALLLFESQGSDLAAADGPGSLLKTESIPSSLAPENAAKRALEAGLECRISSSGAEPQAGSDSTKEELFSTYEAGSATRLSASDRPASLSPYDEPSERDSAGVSYGAFSVEQAAEMQKQAEELEEARAVPLQFAIAGRPNVGKSTLVSLAKLRIALLFFVVVQQIP
jgi:hypothetical protein